MAYAGPYLEPGVGEAYGNGWRQLWKNFLMLFIIGVVIVLIGSGTTFLDTLSHIGFGAVDEGDVVGAVGLTIGAWGAFMSFLYGLFVVGPVNYGVKFAYLKAARNDRLDFTDMFEAFRNYLHAVLAGLLVGIIIMIGFVLLIVPGIIFACKLSFTPYLVVDRKLSAIAAIQESWRMTTGHAWKVFLIGLLGIPLFIAGLLCFGVGIIVSIMWTKLASASLYHAVDMEDARLAGDY